MIISKYNTKDVIEYKKLLIPILIGLIESNIKLIDKISKLKNIDKIILENIMLEIKIIREYLISLSLLLYK